jgi:hypothetical protein
VDELWDKLSRAYDSGIQASGKEVHFLILLAFLLSFGFIRTSAHMIRAQVSWWPGNVETKGGTHVHHMVWGILLLIISGYLGLALDPGSPWRELTAVAFGIGLGLTLDEFALWLNLQDVYWQQKGRQSIDAVVVTGTLLAVTLIGLPFWIDVFQAFLTTAGVGGPRLSSGESAAILVPVQVVGVLLALACFYKGKRFAAIVGMFIPIVALVGVLRLARPDSRWARRFYHGDKQSKARTRFAGDRGDPPVVVGAPGQPLA